MKYILYMINKTTNHADRLGEYNTLPEVSKDRDTYASNARYNNYTFRIKGVMI
jgi:hypothetical protein